MNNQTQQPQQRQPQPPAETATVAELPRDRKPYETPAVETYSPLEHVRDYRDRYSYYYY